MVALNLDGNYDIIRIAGWRLKESGNIGVVDQARTYQCTKRVFVWEENLRCNADRQNAVPEFMVMDMLFKLVPPQR